MGTTAGDKPGNQDRVRASTAEGVLLTSTVVVPFTASSVAHARREMARDLRGRGVAPLLLENATLVLSELLSNALKHARPLPSGGVRVRWSSTDDTVELEVTDGGAPTRPRANAAAMSATGGRGLGIVRDLTCDWGVTENGELTTVWAVVAPNERHVDLRRRLQRRA